MASTFPRLLVILTALSTVLAGVPISAAAEGEGPSIGAARGPADDASKPRSEHDSEESEPENDLEVKLLAERTDASGPCSDTFVSLESAACPGIRWLTWSSALIRGPPASA